MNSIYNWIMKIIFQNAEIKRKNETVELSGLQEAILPHYWEIAWTFAFGDTKIEITSGADGMHSKGSMHYKGKAVDIRIWNFVGCFAPLKTEKWWAQLEYACYQFATALGPKYTVVLEKHHIHLQLGRDNIKNPSEGIGPHKNLFISRKGRLVES